MLISSYPGIPSLSIKLKINQSLQNIFKSIFEFSSYFTRSYNNLHQKIPLAKNQRNQKSEIECLKPWSPRQELNTNRQEMENEISPPSMVNLKIYCKNKMINGRGEFQAAVAIVSIRIKIFIRVRTHSQTSRLIKHRQ